MYSTCLFCNAGLGANEVIEQFPVGRCLAFDAARGRLWVVCSRCERWNLTPIEERFEAIEECERRFRGTYARVSTDNIGLARLPEGLGLIRIGRPLRPEFAAWRYAGELFSRRSRARTLAAATVVGGGLAAIAALAILGPAALGAGAASLVAIPGVTTLVVIFPVSAIAVARDQFLFERVVARVRRDDGVMVGVRAKHAQSIRLRMIPGEEASLEVPYDDGWLALTGARAMHATGVIVANTNRSGAAVGLVQSAVNQIERSGTAAGFLETASRRQDWRGRGTRSVLNRFRGIGTMNLNGVERLALEMSVHEETERRALEGEMMGLETAWRDAEEIARIVDAELTELPGRTD